MEVHQILPAISPHDAVSNNAIEIHKFLLKSGYPSKIFCKHIHPDLTRYVNDLTKYSGSHENVLFYHFSCRGEVSNIVKIS